MMVTDQLPIENSLDLGEIRDGRCVLFLGAGVHAPPGADTEFEYPEEHRPPLGRHLSHLLAQTSGFQQAHPDESPDNLERVSMYVATNPNRQRLIQALNGHLEDGPKPSAALRMIARMPFRVIVTTNYDRLLEAALRETGKDPHVCIYDPAGKRPTADIADDPTSQRPLVFKMHGCLSQPESIVITEEDYITFILRMTARRAFHPVPETVLFRMMRWTTLFVGYSLRDYNLRLLFRTLRYSLDPARIPPAYSVDLRPDPLIQSVWQDPHNLVTFLVEDLWRFVPWLTERLGIEGEADA